MIKPRRVAMLPAHPYFCPEISDIGGIAN